MREMATAWTYGTRTWRKIASLTMSAVSSTFGAHCPVHSEECAFRSRGSFCFCSTNQGSLVISFRSGTQSDPCISSVIPSIMITSSDSPVNETEYEGQTPRLTWATAGVPPVWVAGYGPKVLDLAGRIADGVILQFADPDLIAWCVGFVKKGAEAAGRDPRKIEIMAAAPVWFPPILRWAGNEFAGSPRWCRTTPPISFRATSPRNSRLL